MAKYFRMFIYIIKFFNIIQILKKSGHLATNPQKPRQINVFAWPNPKKKWAKSGQLAKSVQKNHSENPHFWPKSGQWPNPKTQKWPQKESRQTIFTSLSGQFSDRHTLIQVRYPRFSLANLQ